MSINLRKTEKMTVYCQPDKEKNVITKETETVKLSCSYSTTSNEVRLFWYRQYLHGELLFLTYRGPDLRLYSKATKEIKHVDLIIFSASISDSALYYVLCSPQ
uniref:Immunoglobulin V-set domain-containing protein n=1 Tax=Cyprinus carpio TaxID=7962 RepID=A0A8C1WB39_CYPCA